MTDQQYWEVLWRWFAAEVPEVEILGRTLDEVESAFVGAMMESNQYYNRCLGLYF